MWNFNVIYLHFFKLLVGAAVSSYWRQDTWTSTDLLVMRVGCCRTRSSSRPSLSSSRLRAMSASWPMTLNASSRLRNMENSLCRCRVLTRISSVIRPVETCSSRVTSAQGITNLTGGRKTRVKCLIWSGWEHVVPHFSWNEKFEYQEVAKDNFGSHSLKPLNYTF